MSTMADFKVIIVNINTAVRGMERKTALNNMNNVFQARQGLPGQGHWAACSRHSSAKKDPPKTGMRRGKRKYLSDERGKYHMAKQRSKATMTAITTDSLNFFL